MTDRATPNLPSRDFGATSEFYRRLGFAEVYRDDGWMILKSGYLVLEFFPKPDLDPAASAFSCCVRVDDLDALYEACRKADIPEVTEGLPRAEPPAVDEHDLLMAHLFDPDGNLLRLIQNPE